MYNLTAQELIYKALIDEACEIDKVDFIVNNYDADVPDSEFGYNLWNHLLGVCGECYEIESEFRDGVVANLQPKTYSRHYDVCVKAAEIDGVWVAWDYYSGGGKHGEPEAFDWISNARIVDCEVKMVLMPKYNFKEVL